MNKIFYFTSAQDNEGFKMSLSFWRVPPNTSNQNFHYKMIKSLSLAGEVNVVSLRPINSNFGAKTLQGGAVIENNVIWNYIKVSNSKIDKFLNTYKRIEGIVSSSVDGNSTIFVDTLNTWLLSAAIKLSKKYGCRVIGVCTDNPRNISFTKKNRQEQMIKLGQKLDGYISLTSKINELYNINNKPYVIVDGVTEEVQSDSSIKIEGKYIFFGGSLMRKYGVYNLIDAFNKINNPDLKLVLCGHHKETGFESYIKDMHNVIFLGALAYEDVNNVERNAYIAINPRPIDAQIDDYSIPSKVLEYMANGALTISVNNKLLKEKYDDAIIWSKTGDVEDLYEALEFALNLDNKDREKYINNAKKLVKQYTSLESINKIINEVLL